MPKEMFQGMCASVGLQFERGLFDLRPERSLNERWPEIGTRGVRELVGEAWRGK